MKRSGLIAGILALSLHCMVAMAAEEKIDVKTLEKSVDKALKAYNDDDHKKFWAEFSKMADALKTKEIFDALYTNGYKKTFGKLVKRGDLIQDKSTLEGEIGLARFTAEFEKDKKLEVDVNWVKEGKDIKFQQIQINKPQE
jgi:ribosomal protein S20